VAPNARAQHIAERAGLSTFVVFSDYGVVEPLVRSLLYRATGLVDAGLAIFFNSVPVSVCFRGNHSGLIVKITGWVRFANIGSSLFA